MPRLFLLVLAVLLGGCATEALDSEDKAFFYKGWWNPEQGAVERMMGKKIETES